MYMDMEFQSVIPRQGTPTALMNIRGVLQEGEMATLLGCLSPCRSSFGQHINSRCFLFDLPALLEFSHVICPIQQT